MSALLECLNLFMSFFLSEYKMGKLSSLLLVSAPMKAWLVFVMCKYGHLS